MLCEEHKHAEQSVNEPSYGGSTTSNPNHQSYHHPVCRHHSVTSTCAINAMVALVIATANITTQTSLWLSPPSIIITTTPTSNRHQKTRASPMCTTGAASQSRTEALESSRVRPCSLLEREGGGKWVRNQPLTPWC